MCGRVVYVYDAETGQLVRKYDDGALEDPQRRHVLEKFRYNVPPSAHLPVLTGEPAGPGTKVEVARWGFPIPARRNGVFNTRIETAFESPMWRGLVGHHHAVAFVRGFYEWATLGKRKVPHFVHRRDGHVMLLAAVAGVRQVGAQRELCFSLLTSDASDWMVPLHDREPVVLETADVDDWLHPEASGHDRIVDLMRPAKDVFARHQVGDAVNSTENDRPELMQPVSQRTLDFGGRGDDARRDA